MAQGVRVTIGAESGILARWLLVAAFGRTAPLAFLKGVTLYLVMGDGGWLHVVPWLTQVKAIRHGDVRMVASLVNQFFGIQPAYSSYTADPGISSPSSGLGFRCDRRGPPYVLLRWIVEQS